MYRRLLQILLASFAVSTVWAQSTPALESPPENTRVKLPPRVSNIFSGDLPQIDLPGTYKFILRPHFGDLLNRDYMRVDAGLRWALDNHFDISTAASVYFNHGLGGSNADGAGIGEVRVASKYIFEHWPRQNEEASIGLGVELPTGHPPIDMTDGHYHAAPTFIIQHNWARRPRLTTFGGVGVDLLWASSIPGTFGTNQPHNDSMSATFGGVYDAGQIKWSLTGTYATTAMISDEADNFYRLQPGLQWYVPSRFSFHSKTQWIIGLGANASYGPDGFNIGFRTRVRAEITFRQVMDKMKLRGKNAP